MRAALDHAAGFENDDLVGVDHRTQPVRDHQRRRVLHMLDQPSAWFAPRILWRVLIGRLFAAHASAGLSLGTAGQRTVV